MFGNIEKYLLSILQAIGPLPSGDTPNVDTTYPDNSLLGSNINWTLIIVIVLFVLVFLALVGFGVFSYLKGLKKKDRDEKSKHGVLFEVKVPRTNELEIGVAERMFSNLYGIGGAGKGMQKYTTVNNCISFEIVGLPGEIRFYVHAPKKLADLVEKQILGAYQEAEVLTVEEYNIFDEEGEVAYANLELTDEMYYPLKVAEDFKGDPLANVLSVLSKMGEKEGMLIQLVISPAGSLWQKNGVKFVQKVESNNSDPEKKKIKVSQEQLQAISRKASKVGFNTAIRVVASAPVKEIAQMHVDNAIGAFEQFSNPGINDLSKGDIGKGDEREFMHDVVYRRMPLSPNTVLNVEELAAIYHFPNKEITTPHINWLLAKEAPVANWVSSDINSKDSVWLGDNVFRGKRQKVCFKREDRRRHAYILGQTGTGKSWLQTRMIIQDIYNGDGVCFIDPHGQTAELILDRIPPERAEDVIYFNVSDYERPLGLNMLEFYNEQHKHQIVNSFIDLLVKMFDPNNQGFVGPVMQQAVRNAMLTAMSKPGSTLIEVVRMLTDEKWVMDEWLPFVKDDLVRRYWTDQVAKTDQKTKSESLGYFVSKFDKFVTNLMIRNIIGQSESSFDIRKVMDEGKILIVNLSKGLIGDENMRLIGLLLIQKILGAALSREDMPEKERRDFYLYVDEFQNFATDEFSSILAEARKYRLNLTVANQYIGQMPENIKNAIFGNVGSLFIARVGVEDGKFLESQFEPVFNAIDIINQPNGHYYVKLLCDGKYPSPFSLETFFRPFNPASEFETPEYPEIAELVKKMSRTKYGRDANVISEEIITRGDFKAKNDPATAQQVQPGLPPLGF